MFYLAAVPAVLLFGIAKGGFGGGLGIIAVPLMSLVMSPIQAAGILLPILCLMDLLSIWAYRGKWVWPELKIMVPASLLGVIAGTLLFGYMNAASVKLIVGVVALLFTSHYWLLKRQGKTESANYLGWPYGVLSGASAGFTSFIAHSGGPPASMYLLRRPLNKTDFVATTVVLFAVLNFVKLVPYGWLGQLSTNNLLASLILAPLAPLGVSLGVWLHNNVSDRYFFRFVYALLFIVAIKLISDGITAW
ncbi:MAG: sulfite exporter TauE/SafE family protein [Gammaproteobacteria bacterium]|nr:sulfite exporter TauE/SafE family protein [Gammaproteobacteria bacterium]